MKSPKNQTLQKKYLIENYPKLRIKVFIYSSMITVGILGLIGGIGYFLDKQLKTYPLIFIVSLIAAYPIIQFSLYKKYKPKKTP